jgi:hypothetical protein
VIFNFQYIINEAFGLQLYSIDGVVIAAQCTATFLRSIVLPEFRF